MKINPLQSGSQKPMTTNFSEAMKLTEMKKSGNPDEKYKVGSIKQALKEATNPDGTYKSYAESVVE